MKKKLSIINYQLSINFNNSKIKNCGLNENFKLKIENSYEVH